MKKIIIASMLLIGITSFAQETATMAETATMEKLTPEQRNQKRLEKLTKELSLDTNQQVQVSQIIAEQSEKREAVSAQHKANKANGIKPTPEEKAAMKNKMMEEKMGVDTKMKAVLTPEQFEKWNANNEKKKAKLQQKMVEKKMNTQP